MRLPKKIKKILNKCLFIKNMFISLSNNLKLKHMETIKKGMTIKNNKGHYSIVVYASQKKNIVSLADGSRYGYNYAIQLNS